MNKTKFVAFNQPDLGLEEKAAVIDVINSGWIGTGKVCHQFEEEFADFCGGGYAVAVSSCTMGLQLALRASGVDLKRSLYKFNVITTPLTFAATVSAILNQGGFPVFVDVDEQGLIDLEKLEVKIFKTKDLKAVIPVHYSGNVVDSRKINVSHGTSIIEDCAHAFGSYLHNKADFKVFSFYANKNITCGEGGMVVCKDKKMAEDIRVLCSQGLNHDSWNRYGGGPLKRYDVEKVGYKGNLPDILAAIGLVQLRRWPEMKKKRMEVWKVYQQAFGYKGLEHSTHFYPLRIKNRDSMRMKLYKAGFGTGIHYKALHLEPAFQFLGYQKGQFPNAEKWGEEELSLPVSPHMTKEDAERIVEVIQA